MLKRALSLLAFTTLLLIAGSASAAADAPVCEPDPDCKQLCVKKSWVAFAECKERGGSIARCRLLRKELRKACVTSECGPMLGCNDRCDALSKRLVKRCLEEGGELDRCKMDGWNALHACLERHCDDCACPRVYAPVCGADGMTYGNACEADCAGVDIVRDGPCSPQCRQLPCDVSCPHGYVRDDNGCPTCECKPPPGCDVDDDCRDGQRCLKVCPLRPCIQGQECPPCVGVCVGTPDPCLCSKEYAPVCGADGKTYDNKCLARCAGIDVAHEGECQTQCRDNDDCMSKGEICYPPTDTCRPRCSIQCFRYDPVCGEDGNTYGCGETDAHCNGVEVAHPGECNAACPQVYDPVCGTDDKTYSNACFARLAGVEVAHEGRCEAQCTPTICNLYCGDAGYAAGIDGCPTCRCNPQPIDIVPGPGSGVFTPVPGAPVTAP